MSIPEISRWMNQPFEGQVTGKWVLTGEHAVIRGVEAVAFPYRDGGLRLRFMPGAEPFCIKPAEATAVILELFAAAKLNAPLTGELRIENTLPFGAGLGSSAALCVAFSQWVSEPLGLVGSDRVPFATRLEDHFHGRSSGMDVATIVAAEPVAYLRVGGARSLGLRTTPRFTLHDTQLRASTRDCVAQVQAYLAENPARGEAADARMALASQLAVDGLRKYDAGDVPGGLDLVTQAIHRAQECFMEWGLVPASVKTLCDDLLHQGALAVKPTGAGGGGFVVALWK